MNPCPVTYEELWRWLDVEPTQPAGALAQHVAGCEHCQRRVAAHQTQSQHLQSMVDGALGDIEVLPALAAIRTRIAARDEARLSVRLARVWQELWLFHRRAIAGVAMAAALGALVAPGVLFWAKQQSTQGGVGAGLASVIIESMEGEPTTKMAVYQGEGSAVTLIWLQPEGN